MNVAMREAMKKLLVRWLAIEILIGLAVLVITPFLFGSIKPFNPQSSTYKNSVSVKINQPILIALKKATKKVTSYTATKNLKNNNQEVESVVNAPKNSIDSAAKVKPKIIDSNHNIGILPGEDNPTIIN